MSVNVNIDLYICDNCKKQEVVTSGAPNTVRKIPNHWYIIQSSHNTENVVCGLKCMRDYAEKRL